MSDSEKPAPSSSPAGAPKDLGDLLSNFALGPAWARTGGEKSKKHTSKGDREGDRRDGGPRGRRGERDDRGGDRRADRGDRGGSGGGRRFQNQRGDGGRQRDFQRDEFVPPAPGVRLMLTPDVAALRLISKEVHQVARVYSLFDIATTLLADRHRCRAVFEVDESHAPLFCGKQDDSVFLTRGEAVAHLWKSRELRDRFLDEETVEVDPPSGNFVAVAKCGMSGEWLGPPNFHTYQTNLRRMHRERFANMPFEAYSARVRTERSEEAVNAWLESMKQQTRWRLKDAGEEGKWITDEAEAGRALGEAVFDDAFAAVRRADVSASISADQLSPGLLSTLKRSGGHTRKHPAMLIPAICKALEAEHLPVFKRRGKLFTGPARPLALPADAVLAERPARMVEWIRANPPAKLEGLWLAVLPEGGSAPPAEYAADLFWMLQQGHVLLFTDDTLVVQEHHENPTPKAKKKAGKKTQAKSAKPVAKSPITGETAVAVTEAKMELAIIPETAIPGKPAASDKSDEPDESDDPVAPAETSEPVQNNESAEPDPAVPAEAEMPAGPARESEPSTSSDESEEKPGPPGV